MGLERLTDADALRFNAAVYEASRLHRLDLLAEIGRTADKEGFGIDVIIRLLGAGLVGG